MDNRLQQTKRNLFSNVNRPLVSLFFFSPVFLFLIAGCSGGKSSTSGTGGSGPPLSLSSISLLPVTPSTIETGIDTSFNSPDLVSPPIISSQGKLFVFLPGTGGTPSYYQDIVKEAALKGYYAIGLEYVNGNPVTPHAGAMSGARLSTGTTPVLC
jgi:hypothetical protein